MSPLALALVLVLINAFFVNGEFALVAVDRTRIAQLAEEGNARARTVLKALGSLSFQLSGAQLGITATSLILGVIADEAVARLIEPRLESLLGFEVRGLSVAIGLAVATTVQMVLGELIPKNIAIARSLGSAMTVGWAMRWANLVMTPFIFVFNGAANWTVRRLGIEPREELTTVRSLEEFELLFRSSAQSGELDQDEFHMMKRVIGFKDKTAQDAMVPRTDVEALHEADSVEELVARSVQTGFSRFPVYAEDLDDVVGTVHVKDSYDIPYADRNGTPVSRVANDAYAVPESRALESLIRDLRGRGAQMAIVIDEYGGTAGVITLEDILEEIVGEIEDEYDLPDKVEPAVDKQGEWIVDAGLHHDELLELTGFSMPDGDWETLAGFLLWQLERIPVEGDTVVHEGWTLEVTEMERARRIGRVRLTEPPFTDAGDPEPGAGGSGSTRPGPPDGEGTG